MNRLGFYIGLGAGFLLVLFALQNLQVASVQLLLWGIDLPVVAIVLGSGALGSVATMAASALSRRRGATHVEQA